MKAPTGEWPMEGVVSPFELNFHHLGIGHLVVTGGPKPIMTVLGSCLALVVFAPQRQITGIIHAIFPNRGDTAAHEDRHFVREGFEELFLKMCRGSRPGETLIYKLFGGASMMNKSPKGPAFMQPGAGEMNLVEARAWLDRRKIQLKAEDVGGLVGRKLIVNPVTGEVHVRFLNSLATIIPKDPGFFPI